MIMRTHKIALRPTRRQHRLLEQCSDYARFAYNWTLRYFRGKPAAERERKYPTSLLYLVWKDARASVCPWGRKLPQNAAKYAVIDLTHAIKIWRDKRRANRFPRFHGRYKKTAFRADEGPDTVTCKGWRIDLPGIGRVRMCEPLCWHGSIREVTVKREAGRRWYACVTVCMQDREESPGTEDIGVDVGVEMLATSSDGTTYENPRARLRYWSQIRRCKEGLTRHKPGSAEHERLRRKLEKIYYRVNCLRDDAHHKAATKLVANKRSVTLEALGLADMLKDKRGAGALSDAALRSFQDKVVYRCAERGIEVIKADRWFPSTQLCSGCGERRKVSLDERVYKCACGVELNRDFNAALNLKRYGGEKK